MSFLYVANVEADPLTFSQVVESSLRASGRMEEFLCLGELGHLLWMELTPKGHKQVSRAWLFAARESWGLPVLSRGLLYVTQNTRDLLRGTGPRLLCYDLRA